MGEKEDPGVSPPLEKGAGGISFLPVAWLPLFVPFAYFVVPLNPHHLSSHILLSVNRMRSTPFSWLAERIRNPGISELERTCRPMQGQWS
jgi:hypothetical protein